MSDHTLDSALSGALEAFDRWDPRALDSATATLEAFENVAVLASVLEMGAIDDEALRRWVRLASNGAVMLSDLLSLRESARHDCDLAASARADSLGFRLKNANDTIMHVAVDALRGSAGGVR